MTQELEIVMKEFEKHGYEIKFDEDVSTLSIWKDKDKNGKFDFCIFDLYFHDSFKQWKFMNFEDFATFFKNKKDELVEENDLETEKENYENVLKILENLAEKYKDKKFEKHDKTLEDMIQKNISLDDVLEFFENEILDIPGCELDSWDIECIKEEMYKNFKLVRNKK